MKMKIAFVINDMRTEKENYTTIRLARRALKDKHHVALVSLVDLSYETNGDICALAYIPSAYEYETDKELLDDLQSQNNIKKFISINKYDVIMLRADPADELIMRPWAHSSSLLFAQLAASSGVIVLNDPYRLTNASNKTYFQQYPECVRPRTCITRDKDLIKRFIDDENGKAVIKPLQGSGGRGVFIIDQHTGANLNQIIEATVADGYAIVQEYLPLAKEGDLRLITLNGKPLKVDGTYACIHRYSTTEDMRSNISAGGSVEMAEPPSDALEIADIISPKLIYDGMYLVGLDIVGSKMMEINVDTPGGINFMEDMTGKDFSGAIVDDLMRKVQLRKYYGSHLNNRNIACL